MKKARIVLIATLTLTAIASLSLIYLQIRSQPPDIPGPTSSEMISKLKEYVVTTESLGPKIHTDIFSGVYYSPPPSFRKSSLGGSHIYICPGGDFFITSWSDIGIDTTFLDDYGEWSIKDEYIKLERVKSRGNPSMVNQNYLPFTMIGSKNILLMGREWDFAEFQKSVVIPQAVSSVLIHSHEKIENISKSECADLKQKLITKNRKM